MEQKEFAFEIGETVLNLLNNFQGIVESRAFYGFENRYTVRNNDKSQLVGEWKLKSIRKVAPQVIKAALENDTANITIQQKDNKQNDSPTEENTIQGRTFLTPKNQPVSLFIKEHEELSNENTFLNESRDRSRNKEEEGKSLYNSANALEIEEKRSQVKKFFQLTDSLDKILKMDSGFEEAKNLFNKEIKPSLTAPPNNLPKSLNGQIDFDISKSSESEEAEVAKEIMQKEEEEKFLKEKDTETHLITLNPDSLVRTNDHLTEDTPATPNLQEEIHKIEKTCPTIEEILPGDEFNQLLYYFKENNIFTTMNLVGFEMETLFYIPGIPEELVSQAINNIWPYMNYSHENIQEQNTQLLVTENTINPEQDDTYEEFSEFETPIEIAGSLQTDEFKPTKKEQIFDVPIAYAYLNIPNSQPFINFCLQNGKSLMSEISREDFYKSREIEKYRINVIDSIFKVWTTFLHIRNDKSARDNYFMRKIFGNLLHGNQFIQACSEKGIFSLTDLLLHDFYSLEFPGIGEKARQIIYEAFLRSLQDPIIKAQFLPKKISTIPIDKSMIDMNIMQKIFGNFPRGNIFIQRCNEQNIFSLSDLLKHDFFSLDWQSVGEKALKEIHAAFLHSLHDPTNTSNLSPISFGTIPEENQFISLKSLYLLGINSECIKKFHAKGIFYASELNQYAINHWEYAYAKNMLDILQVPLSEMITHFFAELEERDRIMLEDRIAGKTLQQVGESNNITRERVRQITNKVVRKSRPLMHIFNSVMIKKYNGVYSFDDIETFFGNGIISKMVTFALIDLNLVYYMKFSHLFLDRSLITNDILKTLNQMAIDLIGEGIDYSKQTEAIESELSKHSLEFLSINDFTNYLISSGYHFYGDFVTRGKGSYALICVDAIKKYFEFDIKLDQDENNEDLLKLKEIVRTKYPGIVLPEGNRALSSRLSFFLVLSGRGRYCPIEKIVYSPEIFEEIFEYIETSSLTSFYYTELFSEYQGRFLAETNIDNSHFLHGVLKYLYPSTFAYERDLLKKKGEERQDINFRINDLLANKSGPVTRKEIEKNLPGINSWVISMTVDRLSEVIQWEYNEFIHISNIEITGDEIAIIDQIISAIMESFTGYASESIVFNSIKTKLPKFIERNNIKSSQNVFYISAKYLKEKYRFSRPHIVSLDFPEKDLTIISIAKVLLKEPNKLSYQELISFTEDVSWSRGTVNNLVSKFFNDYIRISENDYVKPSVFLISDSERDSLSNHLSDIIPPSGYLAIENIFDYSLFPNLEIENEFELEWNGFLLESLIEKLRLDFTIVAPQAKDRRFQRGIIVKRELSVMSFEDLIVKLLKIGNNQHLTEEDLIAFLKIKGLSNSSYLPQELFDSQNLVYSNGVFEF